MARPKGPMPEWEKEARRCQPGCTCGRHLVGDQRREKLRRANTGKTHTADTRAKLSEIFTVHGHSGKGRNEDSRTYVSWRNMRERCAPGGKYYGRVTVCERWSEFINFLADMGERPEDRTIDRIDNEGNYEPSNCRWATPKQQVNNRRPARQKVSV